MILRLGILFATAGLGLALAQDTVHIRTGIAADGPARIKISSIGTPSYDALQAYLGLTDAQIQSLNSIQQQQQQAVKAIFEQIQTKEASLRDLLDKGGADTATVGRLVLDTDTLRKQARTTDSGFGDQVKAVLTADQKTKLVTLAAAAQSLPAIHEAIMLDLIAPPAPLKGSDGFFVMPAPPPGSDVLMPASGSAEKRVMYFRHEK